MAEGGGSLSKSLYAALSGCNDSEQPIQSLLSLSNKTFGDQTSADWRRGGRRVWTGRGGHSSDKPSSWEKRKRRGNESCDRENTSSWRRTPRENYDSRSQHQFSGRESRFDDGGGGGDDDDVDAGAAGLENTRRNFSCNMSIADRSTSSSTMYQHGRSNSRPDFGRRGGESRGSRYPSVSRDDRGPRDETCRDFSHGDDDDVDAGAASLENTRRNFGSNMSIASDWLTSSSTMYQHGRSNSRHDFGRRGGRSLGSRYPSVSRDDRGPRDKTYRDFSHGGGGGGGSEHAPKKQVFFGYKYLEALSRKEVHEIIVEITKHRSPFGTYLEKQELNADWLFLLISIVRNVCLSEFKGNRAAFLDTLCKSQFLNIVSNYLAEVSVESNKKTIQNIPAFFSDLYEFYNCLLCTLPSLALEKDLKRTIMKTKIAADNVSNYLDVKLDEGVTQKLGVLIDKYDNFMKVVEARLPQEKVTTFLDRIADCAPPENFRELSLYPTYEDIARKRLGFVRPNKVSGAYDSVEHYLDVQFRLLREDFIDPLRNGLRMYLESRSSVERRSKFKYNSVRMYPGTCFEDVENSKSHQVGILLNFDPKKKMTKMKWDRSKRFMHGSLLLFTTDDFQTFFYGTVLERNLEHLTSGKILMTLAENAEVNKDFFKTPFLMAESEVFFEPYFLIMKLLRELNDDTFPMKKYIVDGQSDAEHPQYLQAGGTWHIGPRRVNPLDMYSWPTAAELQLDTYQHTAFKAAITKEFCVIQGPPGTGKTFLGLKIVETILKNARWIKGATKSTADWGLPDAAAVKLPILVVCYTNHALDQFLEGMLKFTQLIVRVGGQSRSEVMQKFNLRGRNNLAQLRRSHVPMKTMVNLREEIKSCREQIDRVNQEKKSAGTPLGLVCFKLLQKFVSPYFQNSVRCDEDLQQWLLEGDEYGDVAGREADYLQKRKERMDVDEEAVGAVGDELEEAEADVEDTRIVNEDDIFDRDDEVKLRSSRYYSLTVDELRQSCQKMIAELRYLMANESAILNGKMEFSDYVNRVNKLHAEIERTIMLHRALVRRLEAPNYDAERVPYLLRQNPRQLSLEQRWMVYWHWISSLRDACAKQLEQLEAQHRTKMVQYEEFKQLEDLYVVQNADVVGMTTTGAARLNLLLKNLHPAVVVVEEAAEVLEAHIVASLTHRCQHVILIGDHKQLKPSTAVYELSRNYNIDVSLFERMIKNGMDCPMLNVQHRMRPEISRLITPLIYPDLQNHEDVLKLESMKGIKGNMFFIEHNQFEQVVEDTQSKQNIHEAEFVVKLARYIVQQGYSPEDITILTTYTGQMFLLRELKRKHFMIQHVKCVVVDKYQGEENEIILLSLVRSNKENKIGFLNIQNRVCVALSRAKKGLYVIGNMDCLTNNSELWQKIKTTLQENNALGKQLNLYCEKHDKTIAVASGEDFNAVKEGGCDEFCGEIMKCGHVCPSLCHVINEDHEEIKCREPCKNTCPRNHPCKLFCFQPCPKCYEPVEHTLPCSHQKRLACYIDETTYECDAIVDDVSALCNHAVKRKCYQSAEEVDCPVPCEDRLDCGHACTKNCHKRDDPEHLEFKCRKECKKLNKNCSKDHACQKLCFEPCGECSVKVKFQLDCGHVMTLPCATNLSKINCYKPCAKRCEQCSKKCPKKCWEDCAPCMHQVWKTIPECQHKALMVCSEEPSRIHCREKCERNAPCGHKCKSMCRAVCSSAKCTEMVKVPNIAALCGHQNLFVQCGQLDAVAFKTSEELLPFCEEPCNEILECGDPCGGSCGKCWQGRLHETCQNKCGNTLICGHSCKQPCRQLCPPCNESCTFKCKHSRCPKKCGFPCVACQEPCEWRCKHQRCRSKCGELCDRIPCMEPCDIKLPCGHSCIGFCGEPCPPLCRVCNPEITEIMFGYEDEPDARFVLLLDCHHTIESQALDQHLAATPENGEIVMKACPLCKTPITKTLRYMNEVKKTYQHILNVKKKIFGNFNQMQQKKKNLAEKFRRLLQTDLRFFSDTGVLRPFVEKCHEKVNLSVRKEKPHLMSQLALSAVTYYHEVFGEIISRKEEFKKTNDFAVDVFKFVRRLVDRLARTEWCINRQQILDFSDELRRYHKLVDYCKVLENPLYASRKNDAKVTNVTSRVRAKLLGFARFTIGVETSVEEAFSDLQRELNSVQPLTSEEKRMVNEAMKSSFYHGTSGHWFTCTKGHYYCITECGGAMQTANCPECGEVIGGSNHAYVRTARLAPDMDGAVRPAWSTGYDMRNYQF